ncbi:MAG TPA: ABC transporter substrate-binding protein [Oligoflexia bacterium]|nr:ABC transporter substrate-binding protein [Oligoflexia bacterium]
MNLSEICIAQSNANIPSGRKTGLPPTVEVKEVLDRVIEINVAFPGDNNRQARREKLRETINPYFDFVEMAKRSLGPIWKEISESERKEFTEVFSELLARTYLSKIELARPNMVEIGNQIIENEKALVRTKVTYKEDIFPIDYKLYSLNGDPWKVYDVIVENIGLISNYRNEFASIVRREKFSGLMEKLKNKVNGFAEKS